jgi:hypothetical protein
MARVWAMEMMPALDALSSVYNNQPSVPFTEALKRTTPDLRVLMRRIASRAQRNMPPKFTLMTLDHCAYVISAFRYQRKAKLGFWSRIE